MQWDSLESYFLSNFDLDDEPTENNPDEKPSREKSLVNAFNQPASKQYSMFFQSVIPVSDSFNTFLLGEEPLIHMNYIELLYHSTLHLYRLLLSRFILHEVTSESDDMGSIDLGEPDVLKHFNSILEQWPNSMQGTVTSLQPLSTKNFGKKLKFY